MLQKLNIGHGNMLCLQALHYFLFFSGLMYSEIRGILALKMYNDAQRCVLKSFRPNNEKNLSLYHGMLKSRFFKNRELYWSNLPQNSNCGQELVQKSGVQIPVGEGQIFLFLFLFIFIFSIKNWILTHKILFFIFFYQLNINENS